MLWPGRAKALKVKEAAEVAVVDVLLHTLADDLLVFLKEVGVAVTHFCGDFVSHVDKLPEVGVIVGVAGDVAEGIGEFRTLPGGDFSG